MAVNKPQGASAAGQAKSLRSQAAAAKLAKQRGDKIERGKSSSTLSKQAKAWEAGAVGEERVARKLSGMGGLDPNRYVVLHDRLLQPDKPWNLDHMVVAPSGIYFLDAKNWRGQLKTFKGSLYRHWYAGPKAGRKTQKMDHEVQKVKGMSAKCSERISCPVFPVIVLAGKESRKLETPLYVQGVYVVGLDMLKKWLESQPASWNTESVIEWGEYLKRRLPPTEEADDTSKKSISTMLQNQVGNFKK